MPALVKCPLCGNPLSAVGKKGMRMRCHACRSVFDMAQLRDYYGADLTDDPVAGVHDYETAHMHFAETQRHAQQRAQRTQAQKRAVQGQEQGRSQGQGQVRTSSQKAPCSSAAGRVRDRERNQVQVLANQPTQPVESAQLAGDSHPFVREGAVPVSSGAPSIVRAVIWLAVIVFVVVPVAFTLGQAVFGSGSGFDLDDLFPSQKTSSSSSGGSRDSFTLSPKSSKKPLAPSMNMSAIARMGQDSSGERVLVIEYSWTNAENYATSFGTAVYDEVQLDGTHLAYAYPDDGVAGYRSDSRYETVKSGQSGKATMAYKLPEGVTASPLSGGSATGGSSGGSEVGKLPAGTAAGILTVKMSAWTDVLYMDDPPAVTQEFNLAEL